MFKKVSLALLAMATVLSLSVTNAVFAAGPPRLQALRSAPLRGYLHSMDVVNYSNHDRVVTVRFIGPSPIINPDPINLAPGGVYHGTVPFTLEVRYGMVTWEGAPDDIGATWCAYSTLSGYFDAEPANACVEMR